MGRVDSVGKRALRAGASHQIHGTGVMDTVAFALLQSTEVKPPPLMDVTSADSV